jgi:hypothetical protein
MTLKKISAFRSNTIFHHAQNLGFLGVSRDMMQMKMLPVKSVFSNHNSIFLLILFVRKAALKIFV